MIEQLFSYSAQTLDFIVRVSVSFLPEQSVIERGRWFWAYHIRIENVGDSAAQLLTRHWEITDGRGAMQIVDGEGVVGDQPVIRPGETYDYVSGCPLGTPNGQMVGTFQMVGTDGMKFDIAVPLFQLTTPVGVQ
jgi:ApaG protein